jgi:hypothetical protein
MLLLIYMKPGNLGTYNALSEIWSIGPYVFKRAVLTAEICDVE